MALLVFANIFLMACTIFVELYIRCASVQNRGRDGRWFVRYGTALVIVLWNALGSCFFLGMFVCLRSIVFCISWFVVFCGSCGRRNIFGAFSIS